jgi:formate C-acetyltransferase
MEVTLLPADVAGEAGARRIADLVRSYFGLGGSQLTFNVMDAATLRDAQAHPERYPELLVRMSGFSTRFVALDAATQADVIRRVSGALDVDL